MVLEICDIVFSYERKNVLDHVSAEAHSGELTAIAGANGVGKSTLLKCIARLIEPAHGSIRLDGSELTNFSLKELAKIQAYVPQSSTFAFPLTCLEYITLGRRPYVEWSLKEQDRKVVEEVVRYLDIEAFLQQPVGQLSGGERQKVMLARALVQEPKILLLDEPTSALDIRHQLEVMELLKKIAMDRKCIVLIVMHELNMIGRFADKTVLLSEGRVLKSGDTREVLSEESILKAYKVKAEFCDSSVGRMIVPIREA
ncbi:MAG: ABC transporter ATP-binding protein [Bacillota bacterium]|nr:ABC transporter ATP-binding protein [Bacillota bacterium]